MTTNDGTKQPQALVKEDKYSLIAEGSYFVAFDSLQTFKILNNIPKLVLWFVVIDGEFQGTRLPVWFNCARLTKKGFSVEKRSKFTMLFYRLFGHRMPSKQRLDRLPTSLFNQFHYEVKVKTVTKNYEQTVYPKPLRYSKIDEFKKAVPTDF